MMSKSNRFKIIVAYCANRGIGLKNKLPWKNKKDMEHFKNTTTNNCVIMGRNTFESIGKPLDNRYNIVVTSKNIPDVMTTPSLDSALSLRDTIRDKNIETYVIGGEQLYKNALNHNLLGSVIASEINNNYDCDTFFPKLPNTFRKTDTIYTDNEMKIVKYEDISTDNSSEYLYLDLLKDVLENGYISNSRSGKVSSTFTKQLIHDIELINNDNNENNEKNIYRFPMITTKRLFFRRVFEELMWMLRGQTDSTILSKQGNHIWDGNTSRESLDNIGLIDYKEGELGPGYGAQLIHWGGNQNFINGSLNMEGGINQIKYVIDELRNNIFSRRAMINLWNPTDLNKMALPPCHTSYYFSVSVNKNEKLELNCNVVLRSNDLFLGNPFNQIFTQLLTIFIAHTINIIPGKVGMTMMIPHIYHNHIYQVEEQLKRKPLQYPTIQIKKKLESYEDIISLELSDIELNNYNYWPKISAQMAI